ncbi:hypothetical protein GDO81_003445 [Engystomops pustulosus]|uniref:Uncharacterized protein n=1 Tax=Engystomops pustulosus TaxID=76066 RepID=A0AAV6ZW26_ENGPU|nr:hypothetical protein GDO81_003445 [Engystomops pustulosus]
MMEVNRTCLDCWTPGTAGAEREDQASPGLTTALAAVLIFTIIVDILGNVLVILSVLRNKKLQNAAWITLQSDITPDRSSLRCL